MNKIVISFTKLAVAAVLTLSLASCQGNGITGSGNVTTQNRNIPEKFNGIEASRGIDVFVEQSDVQSVVVEADDNVQQHILVRVENGILKVTSDQNNYNNVTKKVTVKLPNIKSLSTESGSSMSSINILKSDDLSIKSESGSSVDLNIESDKVTCETDSGSSVSLKGKALSVETSSSSGSSIDAKNLLANEVSSQSATGSSTSVHAIVKLDAKASTGSSIENYGTPKSFKKAENSGGSVSVK